MTTNVEATGLKERLYEIMLKNHEITVVITAGVFAFVRYDV
jgi:hypothetical protein